MTRTRTPAAPHDSYAHSPLTHALIAVTYPESNLVLLPAREWDDFLTEAFAAALPLEKFSPIDGPRDETSVNAAILISADKKTVIRITPDFCAALRLEPYESWTKFLPAFDSLWKVACEQKIATSVSTVAMRYTNQFLLNDGDSVSDFLRIYQVHRPLFGLESKETTSVIHYEDEETEFDVTVSDEIEGGRRRLILDFNTRWKTEALQRYGLNLEEPLDVLHRNIDEAFDDSLTAKKLDEIRG